TEHRPNPYAPPRAPLERPGDLIFRECRRQARVARIIAAGHFCLGLGIIGLLLVAAFSFRFRRNDVPSFSRRSILGFTVLLSPAAFNLTIAFGAWKFRPWAGDIALAQGVLLFVFGLWLSSNFPGDGSFLLVGSLLLVLAAYLRHLCKSIDRDMRSVE